MSTKPQHNGLSADDRSKIRSAILSSREILESEFERQLERYGVYDNERVPFSKLGHLSLQDRETRREIDAALERELEATEDYQRAYRNYVREATKEYLNRYVGLKTIEARGLVTETLTTKAEYGNRSYLHYTVDEIAGELTNTPDDGLGVALDLAFQEIGAEIRILFEDTDYTAIEPEFTVRRDVFEELDELDDDAWAADEAIGWVYQYFGEKEREEIDDRIDEDNYKVQDTDIATKTQLFTPRYIVEWMVDNSLGRFWLEMYGDETNIDDEETCFYLTPLEDSLIDSDVKDVRDITVLDPACGSGHMLFYAFDVLYEMYLEQGAVPEKNIPREILKHNLYGIDIDPGAVQIAALALYTKAKERAPDVTIEQINVISADAVLVNGEKKQEVLDRVDTELEIRVLEQVWRSFENIREWGCLVRIEERIEEIIEEEREEIEGIRAEGQARFTGDGEMTTQSSFISGEDEVSWEVLKERLLERVRELAVEALEADDTVQEMFVGEVEKSVELLDYFVGDYDVVVTNPPYLDSGKMGDNLRQYIKENYIGTRDVYAAFIQRCWEFAGEDKFATLVTPENYMFVDSYRGLRKRLIEGHQFIEGAHLSGYSFSMKDRPFTIPFVLRNRDPADFRSSRFYRMTHDQEKYAHFEDKISGIHEITTANRQGEPHKDVYQIDQNRFSDIEGLPFVYWFGREIMDKFNKGTKLEDLVFSQSGAVIGNNDRFLRKIWEVPRAQINNRYQPWVRSENSIEHFDQLSWLVDWKEDGTYAEQYCDEHGHQFFVGDEHYLGKACVAFQDMSKTFIARKIPTGHITSKHFFVLHPDDEISLEYLNGWLNSSLCKYIMDGLNPTIHFMKNDVMRLPYISPNNYEDDIADLSLRAEEIIEEKSSLNETTYQYNPEKFINSVTPTIENLLLLEDIYESKHENLKGLIDQLIFEEYGISEETKTEIRDEVASNLSEYPLIKIDGSLPDFDLDLEKQDDSIHISDFEHDNLEEEIVERSGNSIRKISEALEVSPYTVSMVRYQRDLYTRDEKRDAAGRLLSYFIGAIMGRWNLEGLDSDEDGIIVFDEDFEDNVASLIRKCIELTYHAEELYERETEIGEMLGRDYLDWLRERFFRHHHCKVYRRRGQRIPIYWQLESDEGTFSCFIYYHTMDADTFPKLRGQYVDTKIWRLENRLGSLESEFESAGDDRKRELRGEIENAQEQLEDLEDFGERLDALIDDGFEPDFDAGIWENIQKVDKYDLLQTELDKL